MSTPTFLRSITRKARRRHRCWECGWWIEPHTTYQVDSLACDGSAYSLKCHEECAGAGQAYPWQYRWDGARPPLHEIVSTSGEPLVAFDFPPPVMTRLAMAFLEAKDRQVARLHARMAEMAAERAREVAPQ